MRRLGEPVPPGATRESVIRDAGREVARPVFFAVFIITVVYLPIVTLQGVEGKMFRPMALTVVFALIGSLILALTLMPVLAALLFKGNIQETEPRIMHWLKARYQPLLEWSVGRPLLTARATTSRQACWWLFSKSLKKGASIRCGNLASAR